MSAVLLLVLAQDPASEAASAAIAASAADGLDGRAKVELERVTTLPADDEAVHRANAASAGAVVEVSWPDADGRRVHLHAHLKPSAPWIDRDVTFEPTSTPWERGRAVGLAIAAMVPEESPAPPPAEEPAAVAVPPSPVTVTNVAPRSVDVAPPKPVLPPAMSSRFDASLSGELGESFRGDPVAAGARVGATYWLSPRIGLHADLGARASSVRAANARVLHLDGGIGAALSVFRLERGTSLVVYGDVRAAREQVSRTRLDAVAERRTHWLPVLSLSSELAVSVAPRLAVTLGVGADLSLGKTTLAVNDAPLAELPRVALLGGMGLRFSF